MVVKLRQCPVLVLVFSCSKWLDCKDTRDGDTRDGDTREDAEH